jgi:zinc protease
MTAPSGCPGTLAVAPPPIAWDWPVLDVVRTTLANGLRIILTESHTVPLVWLSWLSQAGFECDPPELTGLAAMTPLLLREGTAHRDAGQITGELDDLGADLVAGGDWDNGFLNLELLSRDLAVGAGLLLDMACRARFPEAGVTRLRQRRLAELRRRQPRSLADDEFARALYGDTAYGRSPLGTQETLPRIEAADVAAFHAARYQPATSCLVLVGSFDSAAVVDLLGSFELPPLPPSFEPPPLPFAPIAEPAAGVRLVDFPLAAQTELRVGHAGVARASRDLPALQVLNTVLGGGPSSRLAESLRQRQGVTYNVHSRFAARRGGGPFVVSTSVASDAAGAALAAITFEIERLCAEPVPVAELEQAKRRLLGAELRRSQSILGMGGTLSQAAFEKDPAYGFEARRRGIAAVEPESLLELARRHLHPERLVAVAAGPAAALQAQFSDGGVPENQLFRVESIS